ncbi:carbamoyltransferase HypF [Streptomyces sp. NPDC059740]|uniref:carbamoyltransferase HypF n=1 Tax=Streptomyces sp. NPDC059740 TaxID=3346926 RepID=UPI003667A59F
MTETTTTATTDPVRRRVTVRGVVQGVGFRPFVHTLATSLGLAGQVANTGEGVVAEVEGAQRAVEEFCVRVVRQAPGLARVEQVEHSPLPLGGERGFTIVASRAAGGGTLVPPDTATCEACLRELRDPHDRRYRHPFVTCTHCGPRFTIVTALPYDRPATTMAAFAMCPACAREYADPADRRFHAQPVSCHDCGPRLWLETTPAAGAGDLPADPVAAARTLLGRGAVLAVKGLGGYHLACDALDEAAVRRLRQRKGRGDKPFAVMAADLAAVEPWLEVGAAERSLLTGPVRPIVLLRRRRPFRQPAPWCEAVAPGSPDLGVMLPYTPLHHLLFGLPGDAPGPRVLVMTSGNLSGEPLVSQDAEARARLAPLAEALLGHDRPVHVPCDDSVVRIWDEEPLVLRRGRGYAPLPVRLPVPVRPSLAVGGDLKNAFALGDGERAWLSAHVGDMDDLATQRALTRAEAALEVVSGVRPGLLVADRHPGYRSVGWAERVAAGRPVARVQHHHAHIASVMAENGLDGGAPVIGVAFDGTGYGDDGAVWGGEVLLADYAGYRRFAHLAYVPLAGGDVSVRRPYRMALAHLWAAGLPWDPDLPCVAACPPDELAVLRTQLERGLNAVPTSSMGRLFDAVASLAGVRQVVDHEAQAAVALESLARHQDGSGAGYRFALRPGPVGGAELVADPSPVLAAVVADVRAGAPPQVVAGRFHAGVAALVGELAGRARDTHGLGVAALSGGVFANAVLAQGCARLLRGDGFHVLRHRLVPPNDGGLALGQLAVAARAAAPAAAT